MAFRQSAQIVRLSMSMKMRSIARHLGQVREDIAADDVRLILEAGAFQVLARTCGESRIELQCCQQACIAGTGAGQKMAE